jgi:hypothetical protein
MMGSLFPNDLSKIYKMMDPNKFLNEEFMNRYKNENLDYLEEFES